MPPTGVCGQSGALLSELAAACVLCSQNPPRASFSEPYLSHQHAGVSLCSAMCRRCRHGRSPPGITAQVSFISFSTMSCIAVAAAATDCCRYPVTTIATTAVAIAAGMPSPSPLVISAFFAAAYLASRQQRE